MKAVIKQLDQHFPHNRKGYATPQDRFMYSVVGPPEAVAQITADISKGICKSAALDPKKGIIFYSWENTLGFDDEVPLRRITNKSGDIYWALDFSYIKSLNEAYQKFGALMNSPKGAQIEKDLRAKYLGDEVPEELKEHSALDS